MSPARLQSWWMVRPSKLVGANVRPRGSGYAELSVNFRRTTFLRRGGDLRRLLSVKVGCEGFGVLGIGERHSDDERIACLIINEPGRLAPMAIDHSRIAAI